MAVDFQRKEYVDNIGKWTDIDKVVKQKELTGFLRYLNPSDRSDENVARNKYYREFAPFYNFTGYTLAGLVGEVFSKEPEINIPEKLKYLTTDADGRGNSIKQSSQVTTREITKKGRSGLFVTFPQINGVASGADIIKRGIRSTIEHIDATRIVNWRESIVDHVKKLTLVVIKDSIASISEDGFEGKHEEAYLELRLVDSVYKTRKWKKNISNDKWEVIQGSEATPLDSDGNAWNEIPFCFVGSQNNDSSVDDVDMHDLAKINIAHYRNSADFEDSVWYAGQPQPWISGLDQNYIEIMNEEGVYSGSRKVMPVPAGERFDYAVAPPNPVVRQAMLDKIDLAMALGARFIQPGGVAKTAMQSSGEMKVAHSILSQISVNVSDAYVKAIAFVGRYMGVDTSDAAFKLNQDFLPEGSTAQDIKEMVTGWLTGAVPSDDYVRYMKDVGRFDNKKPTEDYVEELNRNAETI